MGSHHKTHFRVVDLYQIQSLLASSLHPAVCSQYYINCTRTMWSCNYFSLSLIPLLFLQHYVGGQESTTTGPPYGNTYDGSGPGITYDGSGYTYGQGYHTPGPGPDAGPVYVPDGSEDLCCLAKTVGGYNYTLIKTGDVPAECKRECIYWRNDELDDDNIDNRYCFAEGGFQSTCHNRNYLDTARICNNATFGSIGLYAFGTVVFTGWFRNQTKYYELLTPGHCVYVRPFLWRYFPEKVEKVTAFVRQLFSVEIECTPYIAKQGEDVYRFII